MGVDFDGTLARNYNTGHSQPQYPNGESIPRMLAMMKQVNATTPREFLQKTGLEPKRFN